MSVIRVGSCQISIDIEDSDQNEREIVRAVKDAAGQGANLIVLPELATSGYCFESMEEAIKMADIIPGRWTRILERLSSELGVVIVTGISEQDTAGAALYSSAVVLDDGKVAAVYRKTHLWDQEHKFFTPGTNVPPVVNTSIGQLAVAVCYDIEFPEMVRVAVESGAEILAVPVNWPLFDKPDGSWPIESYKAMAHAAAYRIPIVIADRCGEERGVSWTGGSMIIGADGYSLAGPVLRSPSEEQILVADVATGGGTILSEFNDALKDRREELYGMKRQT